MEFYLDTANVDEVKRLALIFPISGVTTNPIDWPHESPDSWYHLS